MISPTRLALAVIAVGLSPPVHAGDGGPPTLANTELDLLTANTIAIAGTSAAAPVRLAAYAKEVADPPQGLDSRLGGFARLEREGGVEAP